MKFLDLFSGIGGFRLGFEQAGHECVGHVEWDKYAQASYKAIFSKGREEDYEREFNGSDINEVRGSELPKANIWNFGAPCQDFSMAGARKGLNGERSSLVQRVFQLYQETEEANKPEYLLYENVKGMFSSNKGRDFLAIISEMESLGFVVEWQLFNSKYFGVPQNRERVFVLGTRKDLWKGTTLNKIALEHQNVEARLIDVLESEVDEKFYLSKKQTDKLVFNMENKDKNEEQIKILAHRDGYRRNTQVFDKKGITETLDTGQGGGRGHYTMEEPVIGASRGRNPNNPSDRTTGAKTEQRLEINQDGVSNTLTSFQKDNYVVEGIPIKEATKQGYSIAEEGDSINVQYPTSTTRRGRVGKQMANTIQATGDSNQGVVINPLKNKTEFGWHFEQAVYDTSGTDADIIQPYNKKVVRDQISPTLTTRPEGFKTAILPVVRNENRYRIRKLTPKECWRLQGFPDWAFEEAEKVNSNSQLYKQAGNSVTVNVIYEIAKSLKH